MDEKDLKLLSLHDLKRHGHDLLEEYVALDRNKARPTRKARLTHAYDKLCHKLRTNYGKHHFGAMEEPEQVIRAIQALKRMIKHRKRKNSYYGYDQVAFAPNLIELQRQPRGE